MGTRGFPYLKILKPGQPPTALSNTSPENIARTQETGSRNPAPCFFMFPIPHHAPQGNARASAGRIRATQSPRGPAFSIPQPIGGGLHGAEPTFDPALRPAADNRPAASRGGPPSRRHTHHATLSTTTQKIPCTIFLYRL